MRATWKNGQIVPDGPVNWPDGCRLTIDPEPCLTFAGMTEDEQGEDAESIARWIAAFDALPPLQMTPEEEAIWQSLGNCTVVTTDSDLSAIPDLKVENWAI
ncbi:MAG TPA: hypothetical protein VGM05_29835 [Planctomycetaceae bacterium]|jgi:hypothetical protein